MYRKEIEGNQREEDNVNLIEINTKTYSNELDLHNDQSHPKRIPNDMPYLNFTNSKN